MQKENKNLELLLQGTLRENEKCMSDLERYVPSPPTALWKNCTAEILLFFKKNRAKIREKTLERELARIAGDNWQVRFSLPPSSPTAIPIHITTFYQANLEIAPLPSSRLHHRSNTIGSPLTLNIGRHSYSPSPSPRPDSRVMNQSPDHSQPQQSLNLAQIEQVRMLILGMEQRLQVREEKLIKTVERAEDEGRRFEALRSEIVGAGETG